MKRTILFFCTACLCCGFSSSAAAQKEEKQGAQSREAQGSQQPSSPQGEVYDKDKPKWAKDLTLRTDFSYERGTWTFHFTITNRHSSVAYRDLQYEIAWFGSETAEVKTLTDVIAPGKSIEFSETKRGPSPFGKVSTSGSGMILGSKEKDEVVGLGIDEEQLDKSIRTKLRIVSAEALPAEATAGAQSRTTRTAPRPSTSQLPPKAAESAAVSEPQPVGSRLPMAGTAYALINVIAARPAGGWLAAAGDWGTILIWESETGRVVPVLTGQDLVRALALSPDGLWMASASQQGKTVRLWNAKDGVLIRTIGPQPEAVDNISFSPDGLRIAVASQGVGIWDVTTGVREIVLPHFNEGNTKQKVAFSPDGRTLATTDQSEIKLWETTTWKLLKTLKGHKEGVRSLAFSPDGQWLASGADGVVKLWQVATAKAIRTFSGLTYPNILAFSPDGSLLASEKFDIASDANSIVLWDVNKGLEVRSLAATHLWTFAFGPGNRLASGGLDGTVKLWDTGTGEILRLWAPAPRWRWEVTGVTRSGEPPAGFTPKNKTPLKPGLKPGDEYCVLKLSVQNLSESAQALELQSLEPRLVNAGASFYAQDILWEGKDDPFLKSLPRRTTPQRFHASMRDKDGNFQADLWEEPGGWSVRVVVTVFPARTTTLWLVFEIPKGLPTDKLQLRSTYVAPIPIVSAKKAVFIVPKNVPIRGLALRYKAISMRLPTAK
jgi:hypothetical protein